MDILDNKSDQELVKSLIGEAAKARNEIACALRDLEKAQSRLSFIVVVANEQLKRQGD